MLGEYINQSRFILHNAIEAVELILTGCPREIFPDILIFTFKVLLISFFANSTDRVIIRSPRVFVNHYRNCLLQVFSLALVLSYL